MIRIEFAKLQRKLEEFQKEVHQALFCFAVIGQQVVAASDSDSTVTVIQLFFPGYCNNTGIINVKKKKKPTVIQLNAHLNPGYQYGDRGKDSKPV